MAAPILGVTPLLTINGAEAAIEFYTQAFGAEEITRMTAPNGKLAHVTMRINGGVIFFSDPFPQFGRGGSPNELGGSTVTIHIETDHPDVIFDRAIAAGGIPTLPLQDTFWGSRYGQLLDPFGHHWSVGSPVRDVPKDVLEAGAQKYWR
jgi:PhnB protein